MMDVIEYIRSLFKPNKAKIKRKLSSDFLEEVISPNKKRKDTSYRPEDTWIITPSFCSINKMEKKPKKPTIILPTIVLDDASDLHRPSNGTKPKCFNSSTPNVCKIENRDIRGFSNSLYNTASTNTSKISTSIYSTPQLEANDLQSTSKRKYGIQSQGLASDFSFRLDEKRKYQELLNKTINNSSLNDTFSEYSTPIGGQSRGRRMLNLLKPSPNNFVDLTNGCDLNLKHEGKQKTSTSETIRKVLDGMDDVVVVKDDDSDIEYLPMPPSPRPDFKIERVNSLKQLTSSCEPFKENWIGDKVRKNKEELAKINSELLTRQDKLMELRQINVDILREQLEDQVKKSLHIKEIVIPVEEKQTLPELTQKQEEMVDFALDKRAPGGIVLASKFNLNITRRDMLTLAGLNWLNDEVINFYMNLIIERGKLNAFPNAYAFNTFFYPKIVKDGQQSVRRWTRKVDIFAHDIICVPIHLGMHWCMAIIYMNNKTIVYYDSMGKPNHACNKALVKYLQDEYADKKQSTFDTTDWQLLCAKDIPQQMNGSDCGMFSCTYAEFATRCAPFDFTQENMPYLRRKMVIEIMSGHLLIQSR